MLLMILGCALILAIGIFMFLKPDIVWYLTESWKSDGSDGPSDFYLKITRLSGILVVIGFLLAVVVLLVLE